MDARAIVIKPQVITLVTATAAAAAASQRSVRSVNCVPTASPDAVIFWKCLYNVVPTGEWIESLLLYSVSRM